MDTNALERSFCLGVLLGGSRTRCRVNTTLLRTRRVKAGEEVRQSSAAGPSKSCGNKSTGAIPANNTGLLAKQTKVERKYTWLRIVVVQATATLLPMS